MTFVKGQVPWNAGKPHSQEVRDKISSNRKGKAVGAKNPRWSGGIKIHAHGYRLIASPEHPFKDKQGYVREHRLVMEKHIGRYLESTEDVHHLDGDKTNNNVSNLELFASRSEHIRKHHREGGKAGWFKKGIKRSMQHATAEL